MLPFSLESSLLLIRQTCRKPLTVPDRWALERASAIHFDLAMGPPRVLHAVMNSAAQLHDCREKRNLASAPRELGSCSFVKQPCCCRIGHVTNYRRPSARRCVALGRFLECSWEARLPLTAK
jgi:hypothetical protein